MPLTVITIRLIWDIKHFVPQNGDLDGLSVGNNMEKRTNGFYDFLLSHMAQGMNELFGGCSGSPSGFSIFSGWYPCLLKTLLKYMNGFPWTFQDSLLHGIRKYVEHLGCSGSSLEYEIFFSFVQRNISLLTRLRKIGFSDNFMDRSDMAQGITFWVDVGLHFRKALCLRNVFIDCILFFKISSIFSAFVC